MTRKLRDAALGAVTLALLLYAAVTTTRNLTPPFQGPAQAHASCGGDLSCRNDALQLARSRDP